MNKHRSPFSTDVARFIVASLFFISILLILAYNMWVGIVVFLVSAAIDMRYVMEEEPSEKFPEEPVGPFEHGTSQV